MENMSDGFLVWRWESTVSVDNVNMSVKAKECIDKFWSELRWSSLILVADKHPKPMLFLGAPLSDNRFEHIVFEKNVQKAEIRRFIWYWVRKLYDVGQGGLRLYVDSDRQLIRQIQRDRMDFPVSAPHQHEYEKLLTRIRMHRNMKIRHKDMHHSYLTS